MKIQHRTIAFLTVLTGVSAIGSSAFAQFTGWQQTFFRGAEFAGNPSYLSQPQNGPLYNFNQYYQRVEFDRLGQGYTYEFFRFFGPDSFNNSTWLDLGPLKVSVTPDPNLGQFQTVGLHGRVGYTTTGIPEVFFNAETGERRTTQNFAGGTTAFTREPIRYQVTFNSGVEDFEWEGDIQVDAGGSLNALGFYDFSMRLINVGSYTADGVFLADEQVTDFDTGPIDVSGNLGMDLLASLFQANGTTAAAVPPRIFSAAGQKEKTAEDLIAELEAGRELSEQEIAFLVDQMFRTAFEADPIGVIMNGFPTEVEGFEALSVGVADDQDSSVPASVPEPGTLILLALVAGLTLWMRPMFRGGFPGAS